MTDPNGKIETGVDKLLALIKSRQKISISDAAQELKVMKTIVEHWADVLDEKGLIKVRLTLKNKFLMDKDYYHLSNGNGLGIKEHLSVQSPDTKEDQLKELEKIINLKAKNLGHQIDELQMYKRAKNLMEERELQMQEKETQMNKKLQDFNNQLAELKNTKNALLAKEKDFVEKSNKFNDQRNELEQREKELAASEKVVQEKYAFMKKHIDSVKQKEAELSDKLQEYKQHFNEIREKEIKYAQELKLLEGIKNSLAEKEKNSNKRERDLEQKENLSTEKSILLEKNIEKFRNKLSKLRTFEKNLNDEQKIILKKKKAIENLALKFYAVNNNEFNFNLIKKLRSMNLDTEIALDEFSDKEVAEI